MSQKPQIQKKFYKRSTFVTHLPIPFYYSPTHAWAQEIAPNQWRVGMTKFATRMLGDMVDQGFDISPHEKLHHGQIIGWLEGFKAISDLYSIVQGTFLRGNPALSKDIQAISKDPYQEGWLYEAEGLPDPRTMDVDQYTSLLDTTIDKILEQQQSGEA